MAAPKNILWGGAVGAGVGAVAGGAAGAVQGFNNKRLNAVREQRDDAQYQLSAERADYDENRKAWANEAYKNSKLLERMNKGQQYPSADLDTAIQLQKDKELNLADKARRWGDPQMVVGSEMAPFDSSVDHSYPPLARMEVAARNLYEKFPADYKSLSPEQKQAWHASLDGRLLDMGLQDFGMRLRQE